MTISKSEIKQVLRESKLRSELDLQCMRVEAKRKGLAEGTRKIARKMKNAGRPLSEIEEFTGLSTETIERL